MATCRRNRRRSSCVGHRAYCRLRRRVLRRCSCIVILRYRHFSATFVSWSSMRFILSCGATVAARCSACLSGSRAWLVLTPVVSDCRRPSASLPSWAVSYQLVLVVEPSYPRYSCRAASGEYPWRISPCRQVVAKATRAMLRKPCLPPTSHHPLSPAA